MADFDQLKIWLLSRAIPQSGSFKAFVSNEQMRSPLNVFQTTITLSLAMVATRFSSTENGLLQLFEKWESEKTISPVNVHNNQSFMCGAN